MPTNKTGSGGHKLDAAVAEAQRNRSERDQGYRARALTLYPWVCGRCAREFTRANVHELTVHHRDHNHDNNPPDGSNWELLCLYCHDNEHRRVVDSQGAAASGLSERSGRAATYKPFAELEELLKRSK